MIEENEIVDYEVFVDCTPLHNYVPNDPILEALQNQRKMVKSFDGKSEKVPPAVSSDQLQVAQPETTAGHKRRRRDERPSWLPPDWHVEKKTCLQGTKAGCRDSMFVDPMGNRFRSKKRVLSFLATGVLPRRRARNNPILAMANGGGEISKEEVFQVKLQESCHGYTQILPTCIGSIE